MKVFVPLSKQQIQMYKSVLMKDIETLADESNVSPEFRATRAKILANLNMQLRRLCLHPYLLHGLSSEQQTAEKMLGASGKLAVLDMLLRSLFQKRHRVVLFSQFTSMLDILVDYCNVRGWTFCRYDGSTPRAKRNYVVNAFNAADSTIFLFLMSSRAGNLGCKFTRVSIYLQCISCLNQRIPLVLFFSESSGWI